jgi:hypothetical protein
MTRLDEIPTAFEPPPGARPSEVVARIRSVRPSRRAVLRGLVIGAAATALVPFDWYLTRREASAQAEGRTSGDRSEHLGCTPESYREEANNWPVGGPAVCYGGWRRGGYPCSDGYHREGSHASGTETYESTRLTTNCHGRNAWRWNGYRCSDAITMCTFQDGTDYNGITIAACEVAPLGGGDGDPSRPGTLLPGLGLGLDALPGIGALLGR